MMSTLKRNFIFVQLFLVNCFVSDLCGMNIKLLMKKSYNIQRGSHELTPKISNATSVTNNSKRVTLGNMIDMFVIFRVNGGILLNNYFITPIKETDEEKDRKIRVQDVLEASGKERTEPLFFKKRMCEKLFNAIAKFDKQGAPLAGDLPGLYESIPPDDNTYGLMKIQNMNQIVESELSMLSMARTIKSHINYMKKNANDEFSKICGQAAKGPYYSDEEIWFINFLYASLTCPLSRNDYFLTTT